MLPAALLFGLFLLVQVLAEESLSSTKFQAVRHQTTSKATPRRKGSVERRFSLNNLVGNLFGGSSDGTAYQQPSPPLRANSWGGWGPENSPGGGWNSMVNFNGQIISSNSINSNPWPFGPAPPSPWRPNNRPVQPPVRPPVPPNPDPTLPPYLPPTRGPIVPFTDPPTTEQLPIIPAQLRLCPRVYVLVNGSTYGPFRVESYFFRGSEQFVKIQLSDGSTREYPYRQTYC